MVNGFGARLSLVAPLLASVALVSGCMSSPTYGTGTPADKQLLSDVTGILSIGPKERPRIDYKPRPELVTPADRSVLPPPQTNAVADASGVWPESPEERRARIRAEATANRDNLDFEPEVISSGQRTTGITSASRYHERGNMETEPNPSKQREEFNRRLAENRQGNPTTRKYLSEPPLTYRETAATAPVGDIGEDEWKKERRQKRAAKKSGSFSIGDLWPF